MENLDLDIFSVMGLGLLAMAWAFWPQWRQGYRRWRRRRERRAMWVHG